MRINNNITPAIINILGEGLDFKWGDEVLKQAGIGDNAIQQLVNLSDHIMGLINSVNDAERQQGYQLGTILIFQLRTFLTGHNIDFMFGITNKKNIITKFNVHSQQEVLKGFKVNLEQQVMQLDRQIFSKRNQERALYIGQSNEIAFLNRIIKLSGMQDAKEVQISENNQLYNLEAKGIFFTKRKEAVDERFYRKLSADQNAYVKYRGIYRSFYYMQDDGLLINYNKGWLFEWGKDYLNSVTNTKNQKNNIVINDEALNKVMKNRKRENIKGIHGGDLSQTIKDKDNKIVSKFQQAKLDNIDFITTNSVQETLVAIIKLLKSEKLSKRKIIKGFQEIFLESQQVKNGITNSIEKIQQSSIDELLKNFDFSKKI